jgi:tRNA A-37 threonylcarbamoyl transferase component Bud32
MVNIRDKLKSTYYNFIGNFFIPPNELYDKNGNVVVSCSDLKSMSQKSEVYYVSFENIPFIIKKVNNDNEYTSSKKLKGIITVPNVYYYHEFTDTKVIFYEYIHGLTLHEWILSEKYTIHDFRKILKSIMDVLFKIYEHYPYFKHNDLNTNNIILVNEKPILLDFDETSFDDNSKQELHDMYRLFYFIIKYGEVDKNVSDFIYSIFPPTKYFKASMYTWGKGYLHIKKDEMLPSLAQLYEHPFFS